MELKMSELNNNSSDDHIYDAILKKINELPSKPTKPKISYDDILTSLNMKVNNGKLEFILNTNHSNHSNHSNHLNHSNHSNQSKNVTIPQNIKQQNNYIYNKYFSDYKEVKDEIPRRPLTRREYIQKLKDEQRERHRIYQIKPNKLFFPPVNAHSEPYYKNNNVLANKLFSLR